MNYDTFINSVFVLQGRADEFTTRRPGERKRILSEILGLSVYDALETRARAHRNEMDQEVKTLIQRLTELQQDVERKGHGACALRVAACFECAVLRGVVENQHLHVILVTQAGRNPGEDFADRLLGVVGDDQNEETGLTTRWRGHFIKSVHRRDSGDGSSAQS